MIVTRASFDLIPILWSLTLTVALVTFIHIPLISIMFMTDVTHSSEEEKSKALQDGLAYLIVDGLSLIPGGSLVADPGQRHHRHHASSPATRKVLGCLPPGHQGSQGGLGRVWRSVKIPLQ